MAAATDSEKEMAALRAQLAAEGLALRAEAVTACGPGADAYAFWVIVDRTKEQPDQRIATCRRGDGRGWQPPAPNPLERLTGSRLAYIDKEGRTHHPFRFEVGFQSLKEYRPQTAEQLARAREARETKARALIAADMPLFPDFEPARKPRHNPNAIEIL